MLARTAPVVRTSLVLMLLGILGGCGEDQPARDPFVGRFSSSFQGAPVRLELSRSGSRLEMLFEAGGRRQTIQATIEGRVARGTFRDPQVSGEGRATLEVQDVDRLRLTLSAQGAFGGEQTVPFTFTREVADPGRAAGSGAAAEVPSRDPALVGVWRKTDTYTSGSDFSMASDTFMTLRADGTFRHGDTTVAGGTGSVSASSGRGDAVEGQWKTEGALLYARTGASEPWALVARWYVEGQSLLATLPSGEKELWTRIR